MLNRLLRWSLVCFAVVQGGTSAAAVTVVECREPDGTVSFRDHCPPGTPQTGEKRLRTAPAAVAQTTEDIAKEHPVTLYAAPKCEACDLVRLQLQARTVPFSELDVSSDVANQKRLQESAGSLIVPTVTVGPKVLTGYNRSALDAALQEAGFAVSAK